MQNYAADITRTFPVNGKFSDEQAAIYDIVLQAQTDAIAVIGPGIEYNKTNEATELLGLGLIDKADVKNENPDWPAYKKYFMHGTSHHMGLDTHDYGLLWEPMQANMVFTVEPGIYIPEENMGIRLEDDVVIQAKGSPVNLMQNIPIEIEEIERDLEI